MWKTASPSFRAFARGGICTLMIGMDFPPSSPLPEPEKRTTVQVERENREKGGASAVTTRQLCNFPSSFTDYATDAAAAKQKRVRPRRVRPSVQIELKLAGSFSLSLSPAIERTPVPPPSSNLCLFVHGFTNIRNKQGVSKPCANLIGSLEVDKMLASSLPRASMVWTGGKKRFITSQMPL